MAFNIDGRKRGAVTTNHSDGRSTALSVKKERCLASAVLRESNNMS
jgi:hypothetical protein